MAASGNARTTINAQILIDLHLIFPGNSAYRANLRTTVISLIAATAGRALTVFPTTLVIVNFNHIIS